MATPAMQIQNVNVTVLSGNPFSFRVNTLTPSGTPIDVHTGYTVAKLNIQPSGNPNLNASGTDLSGDFTAAFDTTGVTLTATGAQANTISSAVQSAGNIGLLRLSNDSGTTNAVAARVNLNIDQTGVDL